MQMSPLSHSPRSQTSLSFFRAPFPQLNSEAATKIAIHLLTVTPIRADRFDEVPSSSALKTSKFVGLGQHQIRTAISTSNVNASRGIHTSNAIGLILAKASSW